MPRFILVHPTVWPQYVHQRHRQTDRQTDRQSVSQERQRSDSIGRTVLETVAQKRLYSTLEAKLTSQLKRSDSQIHQFSEMENNIPLIAQFISNLSAKYTKSVHARQSQPGDRNPKVLTFLRHANLRRNMYRSIYRNLYSAVFNAISIYMAKTH